MHSRTPELLQMLPDRGYPEDYLRSRLHGRRSRLVADWAPLLEASAPISQMLDENYRRIFRDLSASGAGASLALEYRWVYGQMNGRLRGLLAPFLLYAELRTIFICLRHLKEQQHAAMRPLLSVSLLSGRMKEILLNAPGLQEAARMIETRFLGISIHFRGISGVLEKEGLSAFEREMTARYLAAVLGAGIHPDLSLFFRRIIDARNVLSVHKWLNLRPAAAFVPLPGGLISGVRLQKIVSNGDREGFSGVLGEVIRPLAPGNPPDNPEPALYRGMSLFLKRKGRDPSGMWPILEYLWLVSMEATNLNLLIQGMELPRELLAGELVR